MCYGVALKLSVTTCGKTNRETLGSSSEKFQLGERRKFHASFSRSSLRALPS